MGNINPAVCITGGTKRIGLALAQTAVREGYDVVLHYRSDRTEAQKWIERDPSVRDRVKFVRMELTAHPETLIDRALRLAPGLTGLVNNAAIFEQGDLRDIARFRRIVDINALVPLRLSMRFAGSVPRGWIVNLTDAGIDAVNIRYQDYRISKLFLTEFTRQLSVLLAPRFRVNAIAPGAVLDAPGRSSFATVRAPLRRAGTVAGVCRAFEYLLASADVTGQVMRVDGGPLQGPGH